MSAEGWSIQGQSPVPRIASALHLRMLCLATSIASGRLQTV